MVQRRPQVVAHRGASATNPEHTLGAYVAALDEGADALECDVRLTADGHLVCVHDRHLRRTAHSDGIVSTMELADLEGLDFAAWKNPWAELDDEAPDIDPELAKVLTMRRLLETAADYRVAWSWPSRRSIRPAMRVWSSGVWSSCSTSSGGPARSHRCGSCPSPGWRCVASGGSLQTSTWCMLMRSPTQWYRSRPFVDGDWIAGPGIDVVRENPELIRRIAKGGTRVHCWVVNTPADIDLCIDLGIEAVITDTPGAAVVHLRSLGG